MQRSPRFNRPAKSFTIVLALIIVAVGACSPNRPAVPTATPQPLPATPIAVATSTSTATLAPTLAWRTPTMRPSPLPSNTPSPCQDDLRVTLDLSLETGEPGVGVVLPGGESVQKGWRVQNTGTCAWDSSYTVQFSDPNNPTWVNLSPPEPLSRTVQPGEMYDIWVTALAPRMPGVQQAAWELRNGRGERVGVPLELTVETAALPTTTGEPRVRFAAYPETVQPGGQVALSWSAPQAREAYLILPGYISRELPVETTANRFVYPDRTVSYTLRVVYGDDSTETRQVRVTVENFDAPRISFFDVQPRSIVFGSECVEIEWRTENRVNEVTVLLNGSVIFSSSEDDGKRRNCPAAAPAVYQIIATGPGGEATAQRAVRAR